MSELHEAQIATLSETMKNTCERVFWECHERLRRWLDVEDIRKHGYKPPPDPWARPPGPPPKASKNG